MRFIVLLFAFVATVAYSDDNSYGGVHITVPFTFDAVGVQAVYRHNYGEVRLGGDSRGYFQAGGGLTGGDADNAVFSGGVAWSTYHNRPVGYAAAAVGDHSEVGAVTYDADFATTYLYAGVRVNHEDENDGSTSQHTSVGVPDGERPGNNNTGNTAEEPPHGPGNDGGGNASNNDVGSNPPDNGNGNPGGGGNAGNNDGGGGNSKSGLGDGSNPGKGAGRDNSPNQGIDNPNRAR